MESNMDIILTIRSTKRFLCFLCALASLARHALGCPQNFLDIIGPGLRVGRGPDWDYEKYGDQDNNGIGTVMTEVSTTGWVTVLWDHGKSHLYRVGYGNKCDLVVVDHFEIQCNFYQTNLTNTGDFLLSYRDFPRAVPTPYHCFEHIQSPDKNKLVALHFLMIDTCNITIDTGDRFSGCDMVSGTYVSGKKGVTIQMYKEKGPKYGFMAYVTYEEDECPHPTPIFKASKGGSGYINSPYSRYTLGSRLICLWEIHADPGQILDIIITYQDDERRVDLREGPYIDWQTYEGKEAVHFYTSHTSEVIIKYEKNRIYKSRGFQIVYKAKDKPIEASCPTTDEQLEPGDNGLLKLPEYSLKNKNNGSLYCTWRLSTKFKSSVIHLTATRFDSADFPDDHAIFKVNGISPWTGSGEKKSFSLTDKSFQIMYKKSSPSNSVTILQYRTEKVPFCYEDRSSISVDGEKAFLVVPSASSHITALKEPCEWSLVSPENQQVSLEIISKSKVDWEPHKAFAVHLNGSWKILTGSKFTSEGNQVSLKYSLLGIPKDFSGTLIITYTAVSPLSPTMPVMPVTQTVPQNQSDPTSPQPLVECPQQGVPIWCYVVIVLLSIASVTLIIACYILYRRQIYMCDKDRDALYIRFQDMKANEDNT